jgi:hypothetical protein
MIPDAMPIRLSIQTLLTVNEVESVGRDALSRCRTGDSPQERGLHHVGVEQ